MKKILLQLHLYFGLACAVYLLAFGTSSLNFNHHFSWMESDGWEEHWEREIAIPEMEDNQKLAEAIRDSLELMGWAPWWHLQRTEAQFNFRVTHFGKEFFITTQNNLVKVREVTKGFWSVFNSLHFLGESIPRANGLLNSFQYYQDFVVFFIIFSIISGIYLWSRRKSERKIGWILIGGVSGFSTLLMLYVWLIG